MEFPIFRTPLWILLQGNKNSCDSFSRSIDIHTSSCLKIWHTRFGGFVRERLVEWVRVLGDLLWVMLWVAFGCCLSLGSAKKKKNLNHRFGHKDFLRGCSQKKSIGNRRNRIRKGKIPSEGWISGLRLSVIPWRTQSLPPWIKRTGLLCSQAS